MARVELQLSPTKQQLAVMSTRSLRKNSFRQVLHCAGLHSTVFGVENSHLQNQVGIFLYLKKHKILWKLFYLSSGKQNTLFPQSIIFIF